MNGLSDDPIADVVADIVEEGGIAFALPGDVSIDAQARAVVDGAIERFGRLDILVNNAGVLLVNALTDDVPVDQSTSTCVATFAPRS